MDGNSLFIHSLKWSLIRCGAGVVCYKEGCIVYRTNFNVPTDGNGKGFIKVIVVVLLRSCILFLKVILVGSRSFVKLVVFEVVSVKSSALLS